MKKINKIISLMLAVAIITSCVCIRTNADSELHKNVRIYVNSEEKCNAMGLIVNYDNNLYVSVRALAYALAGTEKAFTISFEDNDIHINTGESFYDAPFTWEEEELFDKSKINLARNTLYVNDNERKYYSLIGNVGDGQKDAFMNPVSVAMMLDMDIKVTSDGVMINPGTPFTVTVGDLDSSEYMQGVNSLLVGDGTTGDVYYEHDSDEIVPIASTTKLMTYFVMMDAVSAGSVTLDDSVIISRKAQELSEGIDATIPMSAGVSASLSELVCGMILKSSNECALAIAEHVSGNEEAFVQLMNEKAAALGMSDASFYNSNGLPIYMQQVIPAKIQNRMTAKDMFILASALVDTYPQILDITSVKNMNLPNLGQSIKNTNALLYNIEEVKGLKTGTTNKSGACLVTCTPMEKDGQTHNLITVLFGAESEVERATISELMVRYAMNELGSFESVASEEEEISSGIPEDPEIVVRKLVEIAIQKTRQ